MKLALENLKKAQKLSSKTSKTTLDEFDYSQLEIEPTHLYVKFKPQTLEEEAILKQDSTRVLFDYPLDYEFPDEVLDSRPALLENQIPQYYAAIKINTEDDTSEEEYELLEELFIPEESEFFNEDITGKSSKNDAKTAFMDALVEEAFKITGNEDELETPKSENSLQVRWIFGTRWWPSGTIKIWDSNVNGGSYVPLEGAQVLIRQWFTVRQGITDRNGYFKTSSVRGKARYILQWERYHYSIRNGSLFQAETRGPNVTKQDWNLNIKGGSQEFYGTIHRAAHHYYYKDIKGLKRPPTNSFWTPQMKIAAHNRENDEINGYHQKDLRIFGIVPRLNIYNPQKQTQEIYATTIHELAHASHWELRKNNWNDNNLESKVKESWARGVQWELTRMVYPSYQPFYFGDYTGVVQDLIDGKSGYDQVENYTIKEIEGVLSSTSSWDSWKNNLKNRYNNATENNLDAVFNRW